MLRAMKLFAGVMLSGITSITFAQEKCGTVEIQIKQQNSLQRETNDVFESWVKQKKASRNSRTQSDRTYTIPVVFHVIHKGETVGTGVNISDAQIASQVKVLNNDFNRTNSDAGNTPSEFQPVAGSINFNFVLASQDPDGNATNGIVRVKGSKNQWSTTDESTLKAISYWPAEDYLNIWITDLSSTLLGYAQFPVSDLSGLEDAEDNRLTDGVVVDYTVVGSNDDGNFSLTSSFNKGRTATHEVGHFFGLRHIWGDDNGSCGGNGDYVSDTPDQGDYTSGCPSNPQTSCSVHTMFQNYMDYTNDVCMNLFTVGQIERMATVVENSPRRVSLLTSAGSVVPEPVANDLGLISAVQPASFGCDPGVTPVLSVINNGTNAINTATIKVSVNGISHTNSVSFSPALSSGSETTVQLDAIDLVSGDNTLNFSVTATNGNTDGKSNDNETEITSYLPYSTELPYTQSFDALPPAWHIPAGETIEWTKVTAVKSTSTNSSLYLKFYNITSDATLHSIVTPEFDLASGTVPYLTFDVAYAQSAAGDSDALKVFVLSECSEDPALGTQVYAKSGSTLATTERVTSSFSPSGLSDWRHEVIDLRAFKGMTRLRIAFAGVNNGGNNIFLDDVNITNDVTENVALVGVDNLSPVTCADITSPSIRVVNRGTGVVNDLQVVYAVNSGTPAILQYNDLGIESGDTTDLEIAGITIEPGSNELSFTIRQPDGLFDIDDSDNSTIRYSVVNTATDILPLRQNFDSGLGDWTVVNPMGGTNWNSGSTNYGQSLVFDLESTDSLNQAWVVSPVLDLSSASYASVFFDVFYSGNNIDGISGSRDSVEDSFAVLISLDCGASFVTTTYHDRMEPGSQLNAPNTESQWSRKYVDLTSYAGQENVRVAFVVSSSDVNAYLDNIEFFLSADPTPVATELPYTVYGTDPSSPSDFYITFNLSDRQSVRYSLLDITGRQVLSEDLADVLNQTYQIEPEVSAGVYVLKIQIGDEMYTSRVVLNY